MEVLDLFRESPGRLERGPGEFIFREGEDASDMYVLLEGEAEILVGNVLVEVAKAGSVLGEMALIERRPRAATARARTACALVAVDGEGFDALVRRDPLFAKHVMRVMAERLRRMNRMAVDGV